MNFSIGELARRTAVKVPTIRYYEQIGLLPEPPRTEGQQRRYGPDAVKRLDFIRHARTLGFEVEDIRELLALSAEPSQPCAGADAIATRHLAAVEQRIRQLNALRGELRKMIDACDGRCVAECQVLESLSVPAGA
ncbi:MerR family transcriptional regulator [Agaricicola taiwanensis]|uniref:MerR family transcriptional regulator n=1 Tax=Agaricicola taiwanensis TaxID=591372 RepID=A0A8J2YLN1_9RHOB|nr:helix-turn-helix domain-containing protein [Agaricicola taiwanensis]GGE51742.1 MerR family transcriptional regulator [Agaricicola taiwanensis]